MTILNPIGILGGTFDPIHFGHLRTAIELQQALDFSEVRLIPCYQPVHRKRPIASPEQRLAMVQKAVEHEPRLKADDREIRRKNPSYMVDTLDTLKEEFPHTPLCLIMGIDALLHFPSWHRWETIITLAHLVIVHRPHYQLPQTGIVAEILKERLINTPELLHTTLAGKVLLHPVTPLEISATDIRRQLAMGRNPHFLMPDSVCDYIQQHSVYSITHI